MSDANGGSAAAAPRRSRVPLGQGAVAQILKARLLSQLHGVFPLTPRSAIAVCSFVAIVSAFITTEFLAMDFIMGLLVKQSDPTLIDKLLMMISLGFFLMLCFSNTIMGLSTIYLSKEVEWLMARPATHRSIFTAKFIESFIYSSWAFILFGSPVFIAYGTAQGVGLDFYGYGLFIAAPFVLLCSSLGVLLTLLIARFVPARNSRLFYTAFVLVVVVVGYLGAKAHRIDQMAMAGSPEALASLVRNLETPMMNAVPSKWFSDGVTALAKEHRYETPVVEGDISFQGRYLAAAPHLAVLWGSGLGLFLVVVWLSGRMYYAGWLQAQRSTGERVVRGGFLRLCERPFAVLGRSAQAFVGKELRLFWRDSTQWLQLSVLVGLLALYVITLPHRPHQGETENWRVSTLLLSFGITCFVLATVAARFVFPSISMEGRQLWVIGLAPISMGRFLWLKFVVYVATLAAVGEAAVILSCVLLKADAAITALFAASVFFTSLGLVSISLGLGGLLPNFDEPNPSKIANGAGGTLNILLTLAYLVVIVGCVGFVVRLFVQSESVEAPKILFRPLLAGICLASFVLANSIAICLPLFLASHNLKRMDL